MHTSKGMRCLCLYGKGVFEWATFPNPSKGLSPFSLDLIATLKIHVFPLIGLASLSISPLIAHVRVSLSQFTS